MADSLPVRSGGNTYINPDSSNQELRDEHNALMRRDPDQMGENIFNEKRAEIMRLMQDRGLDIPA